ncbi:MAG: hypothetical protein WKG07_38350 [Hymenobacter sp.]
MLPDEFRVRGAKTNTQFPVLRATPSSINGPILSTSGFTEVCESGPLSRGWPQVVNGILTGRVERRQGLFAVDSRRVRQSPKTH